MIETKTPRGGKLAGSGHGGLKAWSGKE